MQAEYIEGVTKLGLPWAMSAGDVATQVTSGDSLPPTQMANIIDMPDSLVTNELTISAVGYPAL